MRAVQSSGTMPLSSPMLLGSPTKPTDSPRPWSRGSQSAWAPAWAGQPGCLCAPGAWERPATPDLGPYMRCRGLPGGAAEHRAILSKVLLGAAPAPFGEPRMLDTFVVHICWRSPWGISEHVGSIFSVLGEKGASHSFLQFLPQRNGHLEFLSRIHQRLHMKCSVKTLCSGFCAGSSNSVGVRGEMGHFTLCPSSLIFIKNTVFLSPKNGNAAILLSSYKLGLNELY